MEGMNLLASTVVTSDICKIIHDHSGWVLTLHVMTLVIGCVTVLDNGVVLVTYFNSERMSEIRRTIQNVYILNLAIADFGVGLLVMIPYGLYMLTESTRLPQWLLVSWNTCVQLLLYQRLYMTVLLSFDRYIMVSNPVRYRSKETTKRAVIRSLLVWLLNFCVATATEVWFLVAIRKTNHCANASNPWQHYQLFGLGIEWLLLLVFMVDFCVPFFFLVLFNALVFLKLRKRVRRRLKNSANNFQHITNSEVVESKTEPQTNVSVISSGQVKKGHRYQIESPANQNNEKQKTVERKNEIALNQRCASSLTDLHAQMSATDLTTFTEKYIEKKAKQENKRLRAAAIKLLLFVIVLATCWLPSFIIGLVSAFTGFPDSLQTVEKVLTLFLWSNSAVDPFLYFALNRHLRRDIRRQLRCKRGN
ncbi:M5 muscarinic receptor [Apostichopus japonicus]|uniref:M5 muscarinic receptor n=1 Tax=Stichopus japonicus TaxID=307972 RepID=A0A2G8KRN1_STIJA|nr:M5 muscarinic receptor [Apostichopus japonicus]